MVHWVPDEQVTDDEEWTRRERVDTRTVRDEEEKYERQTSRRRMVRMRQIIDMLSNADGGFDEGAVVLDLELMSALGGGGELTMSSSTMAQAPTRVSVLHGRMRHLPVSLLLRPLRICCLRV